MIKVVNKRTHLPSSNDIYIGRGSALGNPFTGSKKLENTKAEFQCSSREEAVAKYGVWIDEKIKQKDPEVRKALNEIYLKAKNGDVNLVCYCAPQLCHGDIIKEKIEIVLMKQPSVRNGFTLSRDKTGKDQGKANYANAYIGFGVKRSSGMSSTGIYLEDATRQGIPVNENIIPDKKTIAFVSVSSEGTFVKRTAELAINVLKAGGTIIMDKQGTGFGHSHSSFNKNGEGAVHDLLGKPTGKTKEGYSIWKGTELKKVKKPHKGMSISM